MIDDEEWDWIVEHSSGAFDHVVIASTLPVFLPRGIHHLQAWNEALCAGRWGRLAANLSERLRRAVDLEHWAAFNRSFEQLCDWLRAVARGTEGAEPPASILLLGGDVHCSSINEVDLGNGRVVPRASARLLAVPQSPLGERAAHRAGYRLSRLREVLRTTGEAGRSRSAVGELEADQKGDLRQHPRGALARRTLGIRRRSGEAHARARIPRCSSRIRRLRSRAQATRHDARQREASFRERRSPGLENRSRRVPDPGITTDGAMGMHNACKGRKP